MKLGFVLFNWQPHGGLQQDLVKVVRACQEKAAIEIHCLQWQGDTLPGIETNVVACRGFSKAGIREAFANYVVKTVKPKVDILVGFNRLPGLDYYFAADSCFANRTKRRSWFYRVAPRTRQYLRFEEAVFGAASNTTALLLSALQRSQYVQHYETPPERLIDLPPGIYRKHCAGPDAASLRSKFRQNIGANDNDLVLLQVGSSFHTKGLERSLRAISALPRALHQRVHFCLMGGDKQLDRWRHHAADITALANRLHFLAPDEDVPCCMQGADLLLHPSLHESAGMVILEAVVAGLPVLTTANCGYAAHVTAAGAGLVCAEPFEQTTFNEKLITMLETDRASWCAAGIHYGRTQDLYNMPAAVANILLNSK